MLQTSFTSQHGSPGVVTQEQRALIINAKPQQVAAALAREPGFVWLDSAVAGRGSVSHLTARPVGFLEGNLQADWVSVESVLAARQGQAGGLYGWVGYDGCFRLGIYDGILRFDHDSGQWSSGLPWLNELESAEVPPRSPLAFVPQVSKADYMAAVSRAQDYITAGDIYQVNLSHPWKARWPDGGHELAMYLQLRQVSPAPHAAFMALGGTSVFSASPELFLRMEGPVISTRPIKGTRPRFPDDPEKDAASARELPLCEKERAELLMITDLERNDLGQVCEFGSVLTPDLWRVESFAQVYHLVSTVTGILRPGISHAAAFKACFPGGSISGAPKKRALEIIAELEKHPRGLYTGAIGYFGFDGTSQWNIAIRTAVKDGDEVTFHAGSGIVADSVPEREWEETLHKASGILRAWG